MSIAVRSSTLYVHSAADTASHTLTMPALTAGDGIFIVISCATSAGGGATVTPPAGFSAVGAGIGPSGAGMFCFAKPNAVSGDSGAGKLFVVSVAVPLVAVVVALSGADLTEMIDTTSPAGASTAITLTAPAVTAIADGDALLSMAALASGATVNAAPTSPAGMTSIQTGATSGASANAQVGLAVNLGPYTAGQNVAATTWSGGAGYGSSRSVLIKPASSTALTAALTVAPTSGTVPASTTATCVATGGTGTAKTYAWDWGDGATTAAGPSSTATHSYTTPGTYTVTVTVLNT